ncbi:MAG: class I SAM-dependent methyltransferase [Anaerolineales bacterium]
MKPEIVQTLIELNRQFYQTFAAHFSATRERLQPGVRALLARIPLEATVLDVGCGNGEFGKALQARGQRGDYWGLDFSPGLLAHAANPDSEGEGAGACRLSFLPADFSTPDWDSALPPAPFDVAVCFAVLHHIPGETLRLNLLRGIRRHLAAGGWLYLSNWQFLHSPRLQARLQPWQRIGLTPAEVDANDHLLDWRRGGEGLRYAHHFTPEELHPLAAQSGFEVRETFYSDGENSKLGLYQLWQCA